MHVSGAPGLIATTIVVFVRVAHTTKEMKANIEDGSGDNSLAQNHSIWRPCMGSIAAQRIYSACFIEAAKLRARPVAEWATFQRSTKRSPAEKFEKFVNNQIF